MIPSNAEANHTRLHGGAPNGVPLWGKLEWLSGIARLEWFIQMIPYFNDVGYLPPGAHAVRLDEIAERFGRESEIRRAQMDSVRCLVDLARKAGAVRIILNGSFVTDALEPNDVDCAVLLSADFPADPIAAAELAEGLPFVDLHMTEAAEFEIMVDRLYASRS